MTPNDKQRFNQACGQIFEGLALFHGLEPQNAQIARALVASSHACRPQELLRHSVVGIADALSMAPASSVAPLIELSLLAMDLSRQSFEAGSMVEAACEKCSDENSSDSYVFKRAYAIACSQEAARHALSQAAEGDVDALAKTCETLGACVEGIEPFLVDSARRLFEHQTQGAFAIAESVAIEGCAKPAPKRTAPKL